MIGSLLELRAMPRRGESPPWHPQLVQEELNGGRTTAAELDAAMMAPEATALTVSGLDNAGLAHLAKCHAQRLTAIHFWKCPRLEDLSPLESMRRLTHVAFFWNQRATRFWNFAKTPLLRGLHFSDFTRIDGLGDLVAASSLRELTFGNAVWRKFSVASLEPLAALPDLESLSFNPKAVGDGRVQPLAALPRLKQLHFPSNLFSTKQLAWLRARLPPSVESDVLCAFRTLRQPIRRGGKKLDVLVCGKGKAFLSAEADRVRLERHVAEFERLVQHFKADPAREPAPPA